MSAAIATSTFMPSPFSNCLMLDPIVGDSIPLDIQKSFSLSTNVFHCCGRTIMYQRNIQEPREKIRRRMRLAVIGNATQRD